MGTIQPSTSVFSDPAYGSVKQFGQALDVANRYVGRAKTMRDGSYLRGLEEMVKLFQSKKSYVL